MASARALLLLMMLLVVTVLPALPPATASGVHTFIVHEVTRDGDEVTFVVQAEQPAFGVAVSLRDGDDVVAFPEQRHGWNVREVRNVTFELTRDVARADLLFRWTENRMSRSQTIGVPIPPTDGESGTPRLVVLAAERDGRHVNVTVENVGRATASGVLIALEDADGRKTGSPYYRSLPDLAPGADATASFRVPDRPDSVTVLLDDGEEETRLTVRVHTARSGTGDGDAPPTNLTLETDLPFREVDVGRTVDYSLRVGNTGRVALVQLDVDGLPSGYTARFFVGGSAVPSVYLAENASRQVTLSVTVPNSEAEVDRTVDFTVNARVNGTLLASLEAGLAVRGVGELQLGSIPDLNAIQPGGSERFTVTVTNTGTAPLFDVEVTPQHRPYGWTFRFDPRRVDRLDPGDSKSVTVEVRAPDVLGAGRYPADLVASSGDVTAPAVALALDVPEPERGGTWAWILFLTIIGGILGTAAWWRRRGPGP